MNRFTSSITIAVAGMLFASAPATADACPKVKSKKHHVTHHSTVKKVASTHTLRTVAAQPAVRTVYVPVDRPVVVYVDRPVRERVRYIDTYREEPVTYYTTRSSMRRIDDYSYARRERRQPRFFAADSRRHHSCRF